MNRFAHAGKARRRGYHRGDSHTAAVENAPRRAPAFLAELPARSAHASHRKARSRNSENTQSRNV